MLNKSYTTSKGETIMLESIGSCFIGIHAKPITYRKATVVKNFTNSNTANSWFYRLKKKLK